MEQSELRMLAVATDTKLAELGTQANITMHEIQRAIDGIQSYSGAKHVRVGGYGSSQHEWSTTLEDAIAKIRAKECPIWSQSNAEEALKKLHVAKARLKEIDAEVEVHDNIYRQHHWNRAFLVVANGGHVHKSRNCSTCYPTTQYQWCTDYSGADETEIVEAAGRDACTVCYPSAPADVLNREPQIVSFEQVAKDAAKVEREAKRIQREAKAKAGAATLDGSELIVQTDSRWPERFKTEMTATIWYTDHHMYEHYTSKDVYQQAFRTIEEALAEKNGVSVEEMRSQLQTKVAAKRKKWGR